MGLTATISERTVVLSWSPPEGFPYLFDYQILRNRPELGENKPVVYVNTGTTATTYTDTDLEPGVLYVYRVKAANFFNRLSLPSESVEIRTPQWAPVDNTTATGKPQITGTAQVGQTLAADTSGITDEDGLENVSYSYQWLADDSVITDAIGDTYTLTSDEAGKTVKVTVTFTDDGENEETLTSAATAAIAPLPITGFSLVDTSDQSIVTTLTLSSGVQVSLDDPANGSYGIRVDLAAGATLESVRLELSGGKTVDKTENIAPYSLYGVDGTNLNGERLPAGSYTLRATAYSADDLGGDELQALEVSFTVAKDSTPASGQPTISGRPQVGKTLTADTSGIADDGGLDNATFTYQWLADDVDISGATGDRYTLTDSEEGKAVKVTVSFTDDAGNGESLTSDATSTVAGRPLRLDDFDAGDGQSVLANALIRVGNRGRKTNEKQDPAWYATETSAWRASGKLRDGSLAWNGMTLTRVVYFPYTSVSRFNEADSIHIGESFAAGGVNRELTVWVQTETEAVSFLAKDHILNSGSGWINFETPTGIRSVLARIHRRDAWGLATQGKRSVGDGTAVP